MIYLLYSAIICMSHAKMIKIKKMCFIEQNSDPTNNTKTFTHVFFFYTKMSYNGHELLKKKIFVFIFRYEICGYFFPPDNLFKKQ